MKKQVQNGKPGALQPGARQPGTLKNNKANTSNRPLKKPMVKNKEAAFEEDMDEEENNLRDAFNDDSL